MTRHGYYSSTQLTAALSVTPRSLQYWDECGLITPRHAERRRYYTRRQAIAVGVMARLRKFGLLLGRIRAAGVFEKFCQPRGTKGQQRFLVISLRPLAAKSAETATEAFTQMLELSRLGIGVGVIDLAEIERALDGELSSSDMEQQAEERIYA